MAVLTPALVEAAGTDTRLTGSDPAVAGTVDHAQSPSAARDALPQSPQSPRSPTIDCDGPSGAGAVPSGQGGFVGLARPSRLADTRDASLQPQVPAECWLRVALPASVPTDAAAVAITITSDRVAGAGFLSAHGCGTQLPEFSNLNVDSAGPNSNFAIIDVDATREICVFTSIATDIIVDLVGHFDRSGAQFVQVDLDRVLDTRLVRPGPIPPPQISPAQEVRLNRAQLGVPADTAAVMVNLTVTRAGAPGFLTAYPCGDLPPTSNVNFRGNQDRANTSVVALSAATGEMCLRLGDANADIIVDLVGRYTVSDGLEYRVGMQRFVDSRNPDGGWAGKLDAGETRTVDLSTATRMPSGSHVAVLGVLATRATSPGFLQVRPCGSDDNISSVNFDPGDNRAIANIVVVPLTNARTVCVTASAPTDVVVDLYGSFASDGPLQSLTVNASSNVGFPEFRPAALDYAVVCPASNGNRITVAATAAPGHQIRIGSGAWTSRLNTTVTRDANREIRIESRVTGGGAGQEVWVRCLPPNFPRIELRTAVGSRSPGWYLANVDVQANNYAVILDHFGAPVWYRSGGTETVGSDEQRIRLRGLQRLSNGDLAWFPARGFAFGIDPNANFERVRLDGTIVGTFGIDDADEDLLNGVVQEIRATNHHELLELPNGNFMVISMPVTRVASDDRFRCFAPDRARPGQFTTQNATMVAGARIVELEPNGDPTGWEWNADVLGDGFDAEHIRFDENTLPLCFRNGTEFILGALHPNALSWRPAAAGRGAQVLMSARHADAIYAIDYTSREIVWKLGGRLRQDTSLGITGISPTTPSRQHDVVVLPNGDISVFDNRTALPFETFGSTSGPARYIQYRINDRNRSANIIRVERRSNGDNSGALGSGRLQPDGSVVLGWGSVPGPVFTEVNAAGEQVFEVSFRVPDPEPVTMPSYRVIKEPVDAFDRNELRTTAGGTREIPTGPTSVRSAEVAILSDGDGEY